MPMLWIDAINFDEAGLVPVVAQDATTGELLMLAYADRDALEATLRSGYAHYWSRSRQSLWKKGETSGNSQELVELRVDCDGDAVLYRVRQSGPACHTGETTCFYRSIEDGALVPSTRRAHVLARIEAVVEDRSRNPLDGAYTTYLFEQGVDKILKKVGEEATEVVVAAKNESAEELASEVADLFFHLLVLLRARDVPLSAIWSVMEDRFGRPPRPRGPPVPTHDPG
jgi:phosphoribosyl-AMP cyclohydrolase / phosphoribosyl-ATP pyrophosphohydrolase